MFRNLLTSMLCCASLASAPAQLWVSSNFGHEVLQYNPVTGNLIGGGPFIPANLGGLMNPHGILDIGDHIYVASFGTAEVKRYHRESGAFIDNYISNTNGLAQPVYLAIGPNDGLFYVSSQGNDRIMRFMFETGAAADVTPFIDGGLLDAPSGFAWSTNRSVLYVAGRNSGNVLAYDAVTGAPFAQNHVLVSGIGAGNTVFGLQVDPATDEIYVATDSAVMRYATNGTPLGTMAVPGLTIGLEVEGRRIFAASNNTLYPIDMVSNNVAGAFLNGGVINTLNFFHFSRNPDLRVGPLTPGVREVLPGQDFFTVSFSISIFATQSTATIEFSDDLVAWQDAATYRPNGTNVIRIASPDSAPFSITPGETSISIVERDTTPAINLNRRFYRLRFD